MTFGLQDPSRAFRYALVLIVVAGLVGQGLQHFRQTIVWLGYAVLIAVPWLVARAG